MKLSGQNGQTTRIILAYQPCHSQNPTAQDKGNGSHMETVYAQQQQFFQLCGSNICPHKAMVWDLGAFLHSCKAN
jgi:hypothetical protein